MTEDIGDDFTDDARDLVWLVQFFEFETCSGCGGDAPDHMVVSGPFGKRFALCLREDS